MLELILTVHALSTWNEAGLSQGHCDPPLSETGRRMAELLALRADLDDVGEVHTSDLRRAYDTAGPLAARLGLPIVQHADLREGRWAHHHRDPAYPPLPFSVETETGEALGARAVRELTAIAEAATAARVLVVAHGALVKCGLGLLAPDWLPRYAGIRTALNRLRYADGVWTVLELNDARHLDAAARPTATLDAG